MPTQMDAEPSPTPPFAKPPRDMPEDSATHEEQLAWIHKEANQLQKLWHEIEADIKTPGFRRLRLLAAAYRGGWLLTFVDVHVPQLNKDLWPPAKPWNHNGGDPYHRLPGFPFPDMVTDDDVRQLPGVLPRVMKLLQDLAAASAPPAKDLTERECEVLQVLYEGRHFDRNTKTDTARIAHAMKCTPGNLKPVIPQLKDRGLVATDRGRGSGVWLTEAGKAEYERLHAKKVAQP